MKKVTMRMYLIKKRLSPESKEDSENTTREYSYQTNNTIISNEENKENIDYLRFVEKWYKKYHIKHMNIYLSVITIIIFHINS